MLESMVQEMLTKCWDARMALFGPPAFWKHGAALEKMNSDMREYIAGRQAGYDPRLVLHYLDYLLGSGLTLTHSHFASSQAEKVCKVLYDWVSNQRRRPAEESRAAEGASPAAPVSVEQPEPEVMEPKVEEIRADPVRARRGRRR